MAGDDDGMNWLQDLQATNYIIEVNADRLKTDRDKCSAISNELEKILREQEAKLLKHFSRILYLKCQHRCDVKDFDLPSSCSTAIAMSDPSTFASLNSWLTVVNVSEQDVHTIGHEVGDLVSLLNYSQSDLESLCEKCGVSGENRRRFLRATMNLINYTNRWLSQGREVEPKEHVSDSDLFWDSYERPLVGVGPRSPVGFLSDRNQGDRRSVSESGVDSGASDSGVGSNVSQTSLPTTTPPPSPGGFLMAPPVSTGIGSKSPSKHLGTFDWTGSRHVAAQHAVNPQKRTLAGKSTNYQSTTPPATLKWDTNGNCTELSENTATERPRIASMPGMSMQRSHSHESNLQNRVLHAEQQMNSGLKPSTLAISRSAHENLGQIIHADAGSVNISGGAGASQLVSPDIQSPSSALLSPTSPSAYSSPGFFDSIGRSGSGTFGPPKSPRTGRIMHAIPHNWQKMFVRNATKQCYVCRKALAFRGEKCTSCRIKVHTDCKSKLGENTCGLTKEHLRFLLEQIVVPDTDFSWSSSSQSANIPGSKSMPRISEIQQTPIAPPPSASFVYPESVDSSSSTNSSAPSTPAQFILPLQSPFVAPQRKFTFPDVPEEASLLPHIILPDNNEDTIASQGSDLTIIQSEESGYAESERTLPHDDDQQLTDSVDSEEQQTHEPHKLSRDSWSMHTLRGLSGRASWTDVTIPFDEIKFVEKDSRIGKPGRFGEVHKGYWHQDVAVKLLNMDHVDDGEQLEMFKHEVTSFKNTRHENIVLFLGCCLDPPKLGIVMNLCKGKTLHKLLHNGGENPFQMNRIMNIAAQVTQGMSYLHTKHILHKDLRTKNIFFEPNNKVVITDFGLFSVRRLWKLQESQCKMLHVPEHWLCYLSPEIMRSLAAHSKGEEDDELPFTNGSDVYSFGTVWYELLTAEFPFNRYPPEAILWQVGRGIKPALNNIQAPREIKDILMHCWAFNVEDRPDFNHLLTTLERLPRKRLARSPSHPVMSRSAESMF